MVIVQVDTTVVGIEIKPAEIPTKFNLAQNYPNPFNPSTTIEFDLPRPGFVTLKVFNILGEEVANLISVRLQAGKYQYQWKANHVASGVYLYRIKTEDFVKTRRTVLMK